MDETLNNIGWQELPRVARELARALRAIPGNEGFEVFGPVMAYGRFLAAGRRVLIDMDTRLALVTDGAFERVALCFLCEAVLAAPIEDVAEQGFPDCPECGARVPCD